MMGLAYRDLNHETRAMMLEEIDIDIRNSTIYISNYLNDSGKENWTTLLVEAARDGTDDGLAHRLRHGNFLRAQSERRTKNGVSMVKVPHTAPETMAEGEFGRYYVRGLCRRAIAEGKPFVTVYRAKAVMVPRPDSEAKIGVNFDPASILSDLRTTIGVEPLLGLPPGPNSGLTLCLPDDSKMSMY